MHVSKVPLPGFDAPPLPMGLRQSIADLRAQVREFLAQRLPGVPVSLRAQTWSGADPAFSAAMAERGWIGMVWPRAYGGGERHALERYAVLEEMLAGGAPVGYHWVADRQSGPLILRVGTEEQKRDILPRIARGELSFCIGLSEPGAGSDLAALRSRARRSGDGWLLQGRKVWTSGAQRAHYMIGLFRTSDSQDAGEGSAGKAGAAGGGASGARRARHAGLSQFLIPMDAPGIQVNPIRTLDGDPHFNEVLFDDVALPDTALLGAEGAGWGQAMGELAHERAGPERFLSSWPLLEAALAEDLAHMGASGGASNPADADGSGRVSSVAGLGAAPGNLGNADGLGAGQEARDASRGAGQALPDAVLGEQIAQVAGLRAMSAAVAGQLAAGEDPALHAAMVKDLGARFEQGLPEELSRWMPLQPRGEGLSDYQHILGWCQQNAASFSIRGGTREILRGIIARGLGMR